MPSAPAQLNTHDDEVPWMVTVDAEEVSSGPSSGPRPPNQEAFTYQEEQGPVVACHSSLVGACISETLSSANTSVSEVAQSSERRLPEPRQPSLQLSELHCEQTSHVEIDGHAFLVYKQSNATHRRNIAVAVVVTLVIVFCLVVVPSIVFGKFIKAR
jgi:hypothetical protein